MPNPPFEPAIIQAMKRWKSGLLNNEQETVQQMTNGWVNTTQRLELRAQLLADQIAELRNAGETISQSRLFQMERYTSFIAQAKVEQGTYSSWAADLIAGKQRSAAMSATEQAVQAIGLVQGGAGGVIGSFTRLPVAAIEQMIGFAADGNPLNKLLTDSWPDTAQAISSYLTSGLAEGINPRDIAKMLNQQLDVSLDRAMLLARTEPLRAYRESSLGTYAQSGVVEGYYRLSARDARVCPACLFADDGQLWPIDIPFEEHVCGRCTPVPKVEGLPKQDWETGQEWFMKQDESVQEDILGPGKFDAWQEQKFDLSKFVSRREDDTWGNSLHTTSLEDLINGTSGGSTFSAPEPPSIPTLDGFTEIRKTTPEGFFSEEALKAHNDFVSSHGLSIKDPRYTKEEIRAIGDYTGTAYTKMNQALRDGYQDPTWSPVSELLDQAIRKSVSPEDLLVFRGLALSDEAIAQLIPGSQLSDPGFWSTTISKSVADKFANDTGQVILKLGLRKGHVALVLNTTESEILLPAGSSFTVIRQYVEKGVTIIEGVFD